MIDDQEIRSLAARLGVPEAQVRRDHLLSHLIYALNGDHRVVVIGGTALNRTHLPEVRLSEDLDLHLLRGQADGVVERLLEGVRLEFPDIVAATRSRYLDVATYGLRVDELRLQVQVIGPRPEWMKLPVEITQVLLKYSDLPGSVDLTVPTADAFGAMKLTAYADRAAARDLFDLRELAMRGALGEESVALARQLLGRTLVKQEFMSCPTDDQWNLELSKQVANAGTAGEARDIVYRVLAQLLGW